MVDLPAQGGAPTRLVHAAADMAVEVAVGALRQAERPVHVKGKTRVVGRAGAAVLADGSRDLHHAAKQRATRRRNASARWLM